MNVMLYMCYLGCTVWIKPTYFLQKSKIVQSIYTKAFYIVFDILNEEKEKKKNNKNYKQTRNKRLEAVEDKAILVSRKPKLYSKL